MKRTLLLLIIASFVLAACTNPFMEEILGRGKDKSVEPGIVGTPGLSYEQKSDGTYSVIGYKGTATNVVIPASYDGIPVTELKKHNRRNGAAG